jgi:hypothetical protein
MTFFDQTKISINERSGEAKLRSAFQEARNRYTVSRTDEALLHSSHRHELLAVNRHSRVLWGRAVCNQLSAFFCCADGINHNRPIFLVTLVDRSCMTSVSAADVDIKAVKTRLRSGLRGLSHLGMIEPAYYVNLQDGIYHQRRCMCWHLHVLVWGISERKLRALLQALQASGRYAAIAPGLNAVDVREVQQGDLPKVMGYILKSPWSAYRVTRYRADKHGNIRCDANGEERPFYLQGKSKLRPGERVTLFHTLKPFYLDKLSVSGGQGTPLLARAKRVALSTYGNTPPHSFSSGTRKRSNGSGGRHTL